MAQQTFEKPATASVEHIDNVSTSSNGLHIIDQTVNSAALPDGYWRSRYFLGSFAAMAVSLLATVAAFGYAAPVLGLINADIGPSDDYIWVSLVYTVSLSVALVIVGRLTDIFGRRWFVISFTGLGVVGSIVCMTANNIPVLIGGNVLLGLSTACGMSFPFLLGELVPIRYRYAASAALYFLLLPGSGFAPMISQAMIHYHPGVGWRGLYYIQLGYEVLALILWVSPIWYRSCQRHGY
jgi:MFS family permease